MAKYLCSMDAPRSGFFAIAIAYFLQGSLGTTIVSTHWLFISYRTQIQEEKCRSVQNIAAQTTIIPAMTKARLFTI